MKLSPSETIAVGDELGLPSALAAVIAAIARPASATEIALRMRLLLSTPAPIASSRASKAAASNAVKAQRTTLDTVHQFGAFPRAIRIDSTPARQPSRWVT
jgi:hypothetical protein